MVKRRHIRANKDRRSLAERFVGYWYVNQDEPLFEAVNGTPVMLSQHVGQLSDRWRAWVTSYTKRSSRRDTGRKDARGLPIFESVPLILSATGSEKFVPSNTGGLKSSDDALAYFLSVHRRGTYRHNYYLKFAERTMRHVDAVDSEARLVLEMDAAGYGMQFMKERIRCGEPMIREYQTSGLSIVMSCLSLRVELPWDKQEGFQPKLQKDEDSEELAEELKQPKSMCP